jgi:hypothetical protein
MLRNFKPKIRALINYCVLNIFWRDRCELSQSAELPNEPHLPTNCRQGDPSLTPQGSRHTLLHKDKVEIGNSG